MASPNDKGITATPSASPVPKPMEEGSQQDVATVSYIDENGQRQEKKLEIIYPPTPPSSEGQTPVPPPTEITITLQRPSPSRDFEIAVPIVRATNLWHPIKINLNIDVDNEEMDKSGCSWCSGSCSAGSN